MSIPLTDRISSMRSTASTVSIMIPIPTSLLARTQDSNAALQNVADVSSHSAPVNASVLGGHRPAVANTRLRLLGRITVGKINVLESSPQCSLGDKHPRFPFHFHHTRHMRKLVNGAGKILQVRKGQGSILTKIFDEIKLTGEPNHFRNRGRQRNHPRAQCRLPFVQQLPQWILPHDFPPCSAI